MGGCPGQSRGSRSRSQGRSSLADGKSSHHRLLTALMGLVKIVKYGGKEERDGVAAELEGRYKTMMQSKYSKFLMSKLIRHW